jgi:hypothetical protein
MHAMTCLEMMNRQDSRILRQNILSVVGIALLGAISSSNRFGYFVMYYF